MITEPQHQKFALGVFPSRQVTEQALSDLKNAEFPMDKVSIVARQAEEDDRIGEVQMSDRVENKSVGTAAGATLDATTGAFWGGILVGLTSLAIPGVGMVVAAGSLGVSLAAAVAGTGISAAAFAGLVNALKDWGVPQEQASIYCDRLVQGEYLAIVSGLEDEINRAQSILSQHKIKHWDIFEGGSVESEK